MATATIGPEPYVATIKLHRGWEGLDAYIRFYVSDNNVYIGSIQLPDGGFLTNKFGIYETQAQINKLSQTFTTNLVDLAVGTYTFTAGTMITNDDGKKELVPGGAISSAYIILADDKPDPEPTFIDSLEALAEIKEDIRVAINDMGVELPTTAPFNTYSNKVRDIEVSDYSQSTATADNMLEGVVSYDAEGTLVVGTIPTVTPTVNKYTVEVPSGFIAEPLSIVVLESSSVAEEFTPTVTDIVIKGNTFLEGDIVIKGDANLTPDNIKEGVTIFGVTGTHASGYSKKDLIEHLFIFGK